MGLLACLLLAVFQADERPPLETGDVAAVRVTAPAEARVEHFVLTREGSPAPYAVARFVRWKLERGGERLELETRFLGSEHVLSHVERIEPGRRLLSWRERSSDGVRSVFLDGTDDLAGWIGEGRRTVRTSAPAGTTLPLEWLASVLDGRVEPGALSLYDPLTGATRAVRSRRRVDLAGVARWTLLEGEHAAERFRVRGGRLEGFAWRSNHVRARRISAAEHGELLHEGSS